MPRKSIGNRPMTDAERQARFRAARAAGKPVTRPRRPADLRSRAQRWRDAVGELLSKRYRPAWRTVQLPRHCRRSATSTFQICKRSSHPEGSDGTDRSHGRRRGPVRFR